MKKNNFTPILAGVLTIALSLGGTIAVSATNLHSNEAANSYNTPSIEVDENVTTETTHNYDIPVVEVDEDVSTEAPHVHEYKFLHAGKGGFTTICGCGVQYTTPYQPCEHELTVAPEMFNTRFHEYECHKCAYYARLPHVFDVFADENTHTVKCVECGFVVSEATHIFDQVITANTHAEMCVECGYTTNEERHDFRTAHNTVGHYDVCIDCGYTANGADHTMENYFHGIYHDIECEDCRYESARHIGVKYTTIDAVSCEATCRECSVTEAIPHDWDGFVCCHCGYEKQGFTLAVANEINRYDDGYSIALLVNNCEVWVNVPSIEGWNFDEGDFVQLFHQGNNIYDIAVIIDGDVVCDWNNFKSYIEEDLILYGTPDDYHFEDIVIDEVVYEEDGSVTINFESGRNKQVITTPYVVYDLRNGKTYDLYEGDAILCYSPFRDVTYIVVIW